MIASRAICATLCAGLAVGLSGCDSDRWLIFLPIKADRYALPGNLVPDDQLHRLEITSGDGTKLAAMLALHGSPSKHPTLLYLHGQGGHIDSFWRFAMVLWQAGYNVMVLDYRGYGCSEGSPDEPGLIADGHAAYEALLKRSDIDRDRVVVWGFSLGSAIASPIASRYAGLPGGVTATGADIARPVALVLESPFTSMTAMVEGSGPVAVPASWVTDVKLDNLSHVAATTAPLVIAHGRDDRRVPFWMGAKVFATAHEPKAMVPVDGVGHGEVLDHGFSRILARLNDMAPASIP